ncbi:MAG: hypothetical protein ACYDHA_13530 [Bellilinea sp.]
MNSGLTYYFDAPSILWQTALRQAQGTVGPLAELVEASAFSPHALRPFDPSTSSGYEVRGV